MLALRNALYFAQQLPSPIQSRRGQLRQLDPERADDSLEDIRPPEGKGDTKSTDGGPQQQNHS